MNRVGIVKQIINETGLTRRHADQCLSVIIDTIRQALADGEPVIIRRFGRFITKDKSARQGRNPKTGEPAVISARRVISFRPGRTLKALVNGDEVEAEVMPQYHEAGAPTAEI